MDDFHRTWTVMDPEILAPVVHQQLDCCGVISLTRHLEASMKLKNLLPRNEHLSIQDCLIKLHMLGSIDENGTLWDLRQASPVLTGSGLVLERYCPLTYNLYERRSTWLVNEYSALRMNVHDDFGETFPPQFMDMMVSNELDNGPFAATVLWFPSYNQAGNNEILRPTYDEWAAHLDDPEASDIPGHSMLLTGEGRQNGVRFLEFQDSYGVGVGVDGYVKLYGGNNNGDGFPIVEYVTFEF
uniref:Peptidase C1A papain C-terminal domain-containing protein n=1 Tax=Noccaea caerulescens TaxID=107243 RepID=A0A1J3JXH8_NOCCA